MTKQGGMRRTLEAFSRSGVSQSMRIMMSGILRHYPLMKGYEAIALSKPLGLFAIGKKHEIVRLRNGRSLIVFTDEHVGRVLLYMGDFDPRITWLMRRLLSPGENILDIGANVGWFTTYAADLAGQGGQVHAFEPQSRLAAALRASVALNGFANVQVHEYALSDSNSQMTLHIQDGNMGMASLTAPGYGTYSTETVLVRRAAEVFSELKLGQIRMMKLDVEGHEATVLHASEELFRATPPDIVLFESNSGEVPLPQRDTFRFLFERNYRIFGFAPRLFGVQLREQLAGAPPIQESNDYVAFRDSEQAARDLQKLDVELT